MEAAPRGSANQAAPGRVPMRWGTGTACSGGHALGRAGNLERLTDVGQDVVDVLDAHRQSQVSRRHAGGELVLRAELDRKSVVEGKSVAVRVELGGRRINTKKKKK